MYSKEHGEHVLKLGFYKIIKSGIKRCGLTGHNLKLKLHYTRRIYIQSDFAVKSRLSRQAWISATEGF